MAAEPFILAETPAPEMNMSVEKAVSYLRVSINTLYKWTSQGTIPYRKVGTIKFADNRGIHGLQGNRPPITPHRDR